MTFSASQVAAELRSRLPDVGTKKLHKLLYYCQGHHLAATGGGIFTERVSCWDLGPVVGSFWKDEDLRGVQEVEPIRDEAALNTIGYVVHRYGNLSGKELENLTHAEPPWIRANAFRSERGSTVITVESMRRYFETAQGPDDEAPQPEPWRILDILERSRNMDALSREPMTAEDAQRLLGIEPTGVGV